jgi:branched-chain amino acid transport system substrate-binding protein
VRNRNRAFALKGAACAAAALAIAGCSATGAGSSSSSGVVVKGSRLTIYISDPKTIQSDAVAQDVVDAEQLAFAQQHAEVAHFDVALATINDAKPSDNARGAIQDPSAIAYLGEVSPGISTQTVGITNALDLLELSPTDTSLELGQTTPAISGAPQKYFESWATYGRTFARVVPTSAQEAAFLVKTMLSMHVQSLYVADDGTDYGLAIAQALRQDATHSGIKLSTSESGAGAIFYGTDSPAAGVKFFGTAATSNPSAKLFGSSSLDSTAFLLNLPRSASNVYVSTPGFAPSQLNASAKAFNAAFLAKYQHRPAQAALFGYEAMSALLAVLKQQGANASNRADVAKGFLALRNRQSVLGTYSMNSAGNTSLDAFVLNRVSGGALVPIKASAQG